MKTTRKPEPIDSAIPFKNNKGHIIRLARSMTLSELFKMGVVEIHLTKPGAPLLDGEYRDCSKPITGIRRTAVSP